MKLSGLITTEAVYRLKLSKYWICFQTLATNRESNLIGLVKKPSSL